MGGIYLYLCYFEKRALNSVANRISRIIILKLYSNGNLGS